MTSSPSWLSESSIYRSPSSGSVIEREQAFLGLKVFDEALNGVLFFFLVVAVLRKRWRCDGDGGQAAANQRLL
jgi:hypothetical protein